MERKRKFMNKVVEREQSLENWPDAEPLLEALVTELIPELCGLPYDFLQREDPVAMAECTLLVQEFLDLDDVSGNLDIYNFEAEAMGAEIKFYPDHCADIVRGNYLIKSDKDLDKIRFRGLDTGRFPYLIQYCKAYKKYTGRNIFPTFSAPWTLAGNLYGIDNLVLDTLEKPEFVTELLNRIVDDFHAPMFHALAKVLPGFEVMSLADAFASIPMVTPEIIKGFIRPSLEREVEKLDMPEVALMDTAFYGTAQLSGPARKEYEDFIIWANNDVFFCIDPDLSALSTEYARQVATQHNVPLLAGISAKQVEFGTIQETVSRIKDIVLKGKNGPTPLIFFFNNLTPKTTADKLLAATKAVRVYGRPGADENTPFEITENVSFKNFLKTKIRDNLENYHFEWIKKSKLYPLLKEI